MRDQVHRKCCERLLRHERVNSGVAGKVGGSVQGIGPSAECLQEFRCRRIHALLPRQRFAGDRLARRHRKH